MLPSDLSYPGWISLAQVPDQWTGRTFGSFDAGMSTPPSGQDRQGFDIVYIYTGMGFGPYQFLLPWMNKRTDEYGGKPGKSRSAHA